MKTVRQLAAELGVSKSTLHRLIQKLKQKNAIETITEDNRVLLDDAAEHAIIQALNDRAFQADSIPNESRTFQNDAETCQERSCNDFETLYIESLKQQIERLDADKAHLIMQLQSKDDVIKQLQEEREKDRIERQTILAELLKLKQEQPKVIEVKAAAERTTTKPPQAVKRSGTMQQQKKQTLINAVRSFFVHRG